MSTTSVSPQAPTLDGVGDEAMLGVLMDVVGRLGRQELGGAVDDGVLTRSVAVLHRVETMVAAEKLRRVAEVDARAAYVSQGLRSTADLLGGLGLTRGEVRSQALTAAALGRCRRWRTGWPAASWVSVRRQSRHRRWRTFP